uniref:WD repeat-containing protein 64 n=1 Tax=Leptobrachium leishanense TaxID=445787 RepID=A0A8C5LZ13_9ANUR
MEAIFAALEACLDELPGEEDSPLNCCMWRRLMEAIRAGRKDAVPVGISLAGCGEGVPVLGTERGAVDELLSDTLEAVVENHELPAEGPPVSLNLNFTCLSTRVYLEVGNSCICPIFGRRRTNPCAGNKSEPFNVLDVLAQRPLPANSKRTSYSRAKPKMTTEKGAFQLSASGMKNRYSKDVFHKRGNRPEPRAKYIKTSENHQREERITKSLIYELDSIFFFSMKETIESATVDKRKWKDNIQCIVKVPEPDVMLTASKKGKLTLYNKKMRSIFSTHIMESYWIMGCTFLPKIKRVVAVADKSIFVWNYNHNIKDYYVIIKPVENYQLCVCSVTSLDQSLNDNILVGDNSGFVSLYCMDPDKLRLSYSEALSTSHPVVMDPGKFLRSRRKIHNGWVERVKFFPELNCFGSCSTDDEVQSFVLDTIDKLDKGILRAFSVCKGVATFEYCVQANLIATAGPDKFIRLWDIQYSKKPLRILHGHSASIIELAINEEDQHLISATRTGEFLVWNLQKFKILQKFEDKEKTPCTKRINTMIYDKQHLKLITGSSAIVVCPLARMIQDTTWVPRTHENIINVLAYNPVCQQVLSVCSESILKVWEYDTGHQIYKKANPHGPSVEVTAAAINANGSYFATGACDGSLKLWDFEIGRELRSVRRRKIYKDKMQRYIQLCFLHNTDQPQMIVTLDISGAIKIIQVRKDENFLLVTVEIIVDPDLWVSTPKPAVNTAEKNTNHPNIKTMAHLTSSSHQEMGYGKPTMCFDTLTIENCAFLATGRVTGTINLYKFGAGAAKYICRMNDEGQDMVNAVLFLYPRKEVSLLPSAQSYESPDESQQDKTTTKTDSKFGRLIPDIKSKHSIVEQPKSIDCFPTEGETCSPLIASGHQDGYLYFWDLKGNKLGKILPVTKHPANPLTALCTSAQSNIVLSGDSEGYITVWRVSIIQVSKSGDIGLEQLIHWRAHLMNVTSLVYEEYKNIVISASDDGSLRLFYASNGDYIGYFGQPRDFLPSKMCLPCDIAETCESRPENHLAMDLTEFKSETNLELSTELPKNLCLDGKLIKSLRTFEQTGT